MQKLIITGMPRSGSSLLALFINNMGYATGGEWDDEKNAGMENLEANFLNDVIFLNSKSFVDYPKYLDAVKRLIGKIETPVVKQPRYMFSDYVFNLWHEVYPDMKVILTYRNPEHVFLSKIRFDEKYPYDPRILEEIFIKFKDKLEKYKIPYGMLTFPELLDKYDLVYKVFSILGYEFDYDKGKEIWESLVDWGKVHFR